MMTTRCDRCSDPAEGPGCVTLRVLDGQLPGRRPRWDLCGDCARKLGIWLQPVPPPVPPDDPPSVRRTAGPWGEV